MKTRISSYASRTGRPVDDVVFDERGVVERRRTDVEKLRLDERTLLGDIFYGFRYRNEGVKMPPASPAYQNDFHMRIVSSSLITSNALHRTAICSHLAVDKSGAYRRELRETLRRIPALARDTSMALPPWLMNVRGIPVRGATPSIAAMLIKASLAR